MRPRLLLLLLGVLLAQGAWLLSVPAFAGIDEVDHVYRAASVAHGDWLAGGDAAGHGRGDLVTVPRDLVAAAGPECRALTYTGHDNCAPASGAPGGPHAPVQVASAAARYQPAYYWVVGTTARGLRGTAAVYAMRAVSALLCDLLLLLAASSLSRWARTRWPAAALACCCTPVLVYSCVVVAPNALEIAAAISVWAALAGLCAHAPGPRTRRTLLWAAVPGAVALATTRSLGIGFLGLAVLAVLALLGRRGAADLARGSRGTLAATASVVGAAVVAGAAWLATGQPNRVGGHLHNGGVLAGSLVQLPVWVLQSIAAAPGRRDPAPGVVYLLVGGVLLAVLVAALRCADRRLRTVLLLVAAASLAGPFAVTLRTYRDLGVVWQGRYGMPLSLGVLLLAGLALDRSPCARRLGRRTVVAGTALLAVGQALAVRHAVDLERLRSPSVAGHLWHPPPDGLVVLMSVLGWLAVGAYVASTGSRRGVTSSAGAGVPARRGDPSAVRSAS